MTSLTTLKLGQCCTIVSGATPKTSVDEYWDGDICWTTPKDLSNLETHYLEDTPRKITKLGLASCGASMLPSGSVLFSSRAPIGHVAINAVPMATNQGFKSFIPKVGVLDAKFLFHWLRKNKEFLESLGNGATFKEVSKATVARIEIALPNIVYQRRIAAILDQADALRAKRREALAQLDSLTQSIFIEMFGDVDGKGWSISSVADIANASKGSIRTGPFGSQLLHSEFVDQGVVVLGIDNAVRNEFRWGERRFISPQKYQELKRYTVFPGDVLITIMGTCGRCAVVPADIPVAINTKHICCITLDSEKCLPSFLHSYFLMHPMARKYLEQTAKGAIMDGLNMGIIKAMPVPVVPVGLQHEFEARVGALQKTKYANIAAAIKLDSLFASLQHRAFRGEL